MNSTFSSLTLPRIIVGTSHMGNPIPFLHALCGQRRKLHRYLDEVYELGCTAFDTAASYMLGDTERALGEWLRARGHRSRVQLISKGAHPYPLLGHRLRPAALRSDLHASLRRLGVDQIDYYLLHRDHDDAPMIPLLETLNQFQRSGKIGAWGLSNWRTERIAALDTVARERHLPSVALSSPHFSLAEWNRVPWKGSCSIAGQANQEERAFYARTGLPVLAWSPLGQGYFGEKIPNSFTQKIYENPINRVRRSRAAELARHQGLSTAQIALAYLFHQPFPVHAVVAASRTENVRKNIEAARLNLTPAQIQWLGAETEET